MNMNHPTPSKDDAIDVNQTAIQLFKLALRAGYAVNLQNLSVAVDDTKRIVTLQPGPNFTPKTEIEAAIGEDEDPNTTGRGFRTGYVTNRNKFRAQLRQRLNLNSKSEKEK